MYSSSRATRTDNTAVYEATMMDFSKNTVLLFFLYFIQGIPYGLQVSFLPLYLRSQGISLTSVGLMKLLSAPWLCKALWAPLVDSYSTKKKWLLGSILCLALTCIVSAFVSPEDLLMLCVIVFMLNLFAATQDIAVDGIAIAILSRQELGQGNTAQVVGYKVGSVFSGGVLLWCKDIIGWTGLFALLTFIYLEAAMFVFLSPSLRDYKRRIAEVTQSLEGSTESVNSEGESEGISEVSHRQSDEKVTSERTRHVRVDRESGETYPVQKEDTEEQASPKSSKTDVGDSVGDSNKEGENTNVAEELHKGSKVEVNSDELEEDLEEDVKWSQFEPEFPTFLKERFSFINSVLSVPGTPWMIIYLLIYKLGEQGALTMMPIFLVDCDISTNDIAFWTGIVGQALSVLGSLIGGFFLSHTRIPAELLIKQVSLCRLMPLGIQMLVVTMWPASTLPTFILYAASILSLNCLLVLGGIITTATFTFMMQCSQKAPSSVQATHFTTLATVEVMGKLLFLSVVGWFTDQLGFQPVFLSFTGLAALVLLWMPKCPVSLSDEPKKKKVPTATLR